MYNLGHDRLRDLFEDVYNGKIAIDERFVQEPANIPDIINCIIHRYPIKPAIFSTKQPEGFIKAKKILEKEVKECEKPKLYLIAGYDEFLGIIKVLLNKEKLIIEEGVTFETIYNTFCLIEYLEKEKPEKEKEERLKRMNSNAMLTIVYYFEIYNPSIEDILIIKRMYDNKN